METILLLANTRSRRLTRQARAGSSRRGQIPQRRHARGQAGRRPWWAKRSTRRRPHRRLRRRSIPGASRARTLLPRGTPRTPLRPKRSCKAAQADHRDRAGHLALEPRPAGRRPAPGRARRHPCHRFGASDGKPSVNRWYYRQRMEAVSSARSGPGSSLSIPAASPPGRAMPGPPPCRCVAVTLPEACKRTTVAGCARTRRRRPNHPARRRPPVCRRRGLDQETGRRPDRT